MSAHKRPCVWSLPVATLHWLGAALILALIGLGFVMIHAPLDAAAKFDLYQFHKSLGFLALALTAAHLAARIPVEAPPKRGARWERVLAAATQALLYALGFVAIVAGWLLVSASPLPIPTQFFGLFVVPDIASPNAATFEVAAFAHKWAAYSLAGLVALHVAGALKHLVHDRDDVLARILPRLWRRGRSDEVMR